jgi:hypothetical protein
VVACHVTNANNGFNAFKSCGPTNALGECTDPGTTLRKFARQVSDRRSCTPCTCGEPTGAVCEANVTLYKDPRCSTLLGMSVVTSADGALCTDVPSGPLAGMKAELTIETPGTCTASVSRVVGVAEPSDSVKLCCD